MSVSRILAAQMLFATALATSLCAATGEVIRTCADFEKTRSMPNFANRTFDLEGWATIDYNPIPHIVGIRDRTGATIVTWNFSDIAFKAGDRIHISGSDEPSGLGKLTRHFKLLARGQPPPVPTITAADFNSGRYDYLPVHLNGTVHDAAPDEVDADFLQLVLNCDGTFVHVALLARKAERNTLIASIGSRVSATGLCDPHPRSLRNQYPRCLRLIRPEDLRILAPQDTDIFAVGDISDLYARHPQDISPQERRRAVGRVVAIWSDRSALLRTKDGHFATVRFREDPMPAYGEIIEAVGFPMSDLFNISILRAVWRRLPQSDIPPVEPVRLTAQQLFLDWKKQKHIHAEYHGQVIALSGTVMRLPPEDDANKTLLLESDSFVVKVDASSNPALLRGLARGARIEAVGTCVVETDPWSPATPLPRVKGLMLVPRGLGDIAVLSQPPWWTPGRLFAVIGTLLALIVAILIRNGIQKRNAALLARLTSELKVAERTRLAVELHDSIAQSLTGVALEVNTADRSADADPEKAHLHLGIAAKSLKSCRDELRYCLWDLRNSALENADMNEAIRQTLAPHLGEARLSVRFSVPRDRISDNTAHAILRIVRELTVNAIRHGQATDIKVAGSVEDRKLLFSVRDNGRGFDPANAPGVAQGHYGLLGIRERVEGFEGDLEIESTPGQGTRVTIWLNIPQELGKGARP